MFPLDAVMVPAWHDHLMVSPKWPERLGRQAPMLGICVSDFEVVSPGVLRFKVERRADYLGNSIPYLGDAVGKRIVLPADEFILTRNNERCSRAR